MYYPATGPSTVVLPSLKSLLNDIPLPNETKFHNIISSHQVAPSPYPRGVSQGLPALIPAQICQPLEQQQPFHSGHHTFSSPSSYTSLMNHGRHMTPSPPPSYNTDNLNVVANVAYSQNHYPYHEHPKLSTHPKSPVSSRSSSPTNGVSSNSALAAARVRKYQCKACLKSFTTSGHLARHSRIHTGERKHVCPFDGCNARFSRHDNCMQHFKTHLGKRRTKRVTEGSVLSDSDVVSPPRHHPVLG
ncbi:hypothetical protein BABINDRAFT_159593 [Babjeviella inositovora NRRL Y-12698]|uniref:C2H2-type domain-containing protein n=1 Tax=Babjeviella inositovora NRRL Y-12698 TaxID=984486 RepID=A0A1E3QZN8_9ASCO|nr:uncharacterized protein BABINDRAFT_159593 [Babjeviella inositovora NRRL Y-12698]ODQ83143.1 hypothetical protein BABINDRAFT_159593 [Babjeviella inositovora NRRL Y-12698]